jgi:8-oxo-dGTP pyrophosphatase MutT (NUDIX family)
LAAVPALDAIIARLSGHEPAVLDDDRARWHAATALILRHPADILFIVRTQRESDRWSGQVALPGGRRDPADASLAETARRETREEVGLALQAPVARLDDQKGRTSLGRVSPFVFVLEGDPALRPDAREVAETHWVSLAHLVDPRSRTTHRFAGIPFPAVDLGGATLWGLTLRTIEAFLEAAGIDAS